MERPHSPERLTPTRATGKASRSVILWWAALVGSAGIIADAVWQLVTVKVGQIIQPGVQFVINGVVVVDNAKDAAAANYALGHDFDGQYRWTTAVAFILFVGSVIALVRSWQSRTEPVPVRLMQLGLGTLAAVPVGALLGYAACEIAATLRSIVG